MKYITEVQPGRDKSARGFPVVVLLPVAAVFILAIALYWKSLDFGFLLSWDDDEYVFSNIYIRGFGLDNLKAVFTGTALDIYSPLHTLSYSIDYALWGLNPKGYHLSNVIFHGVDASLLYLLVSRISARRDVAFIAAVLFTAHPLNVENVAWVAERKTMLSSMFVFLSLLSYLRFRESGSWAGYALCCVMFAAAIVSKPVVVTLPLAVAAFEAFMAREGRRWVYLAPLFALAAAGAFTVAGHETLRSSGGNGVMNLSTLFGSVYPTMIPVFWKYVKLIIWPFGLAGIYDTPLYGSFLHPVVALSACAWIALTIAVMWKGGAQGRFWYSWFWIWLLPVSNIIPTNFYYADRYMYLPAISLFVGAGLLVSRAAGAGFTPRKAVCYALLAVVAASYAFIAHKRMDVWRNDVVFWEDAAKKSPSHYRTRLNLGYSYEMAGRYAEAEAEYVATIAVYPDPKAVSNLNMVREKMRSSGAEPAPYQERRFE